MALAGSGFGLITNDNKVFQQDRHGARILACRQRTLAKCVVEVWIRQVSWSSDPAVAHQAGTLRSVAGRIDRHRLLRNVIQAQITDRVVLT